MCGRKVPLSDPTNGQMPSGYDAQDITVLEGLEAVRKRPGMYIGSTGVRGLHHLVYEVVDNSVDEALAGHCDTVTVTIHPDDSVTVDRQRPRHPGGDDGEGGQVRPRGRPDRPARRRQVRRGRRLQGLRRSARRRRLGRQRALGRVDRHRQARRLHLDAVLRPRHPAGRRWSAASRRTRPARRSRSGPTTRSSRRSTFEYQTLEQRLRETAFLTRGLRISITDERGEDKRHREFHYEGGIEDFVRYINENKDPIQQKVIFFAGEGDEGALEVAMQWNAHLPGVGLLVREQHQHARGRLAPLRLPLGADAHDQPLRALVRASSRRRTRASRARTSARA